MSKMLVITGASKGIGLATAKLFADNDYKVINLSRSLCSLEGVINLQVDLLDHDWPEQWQSQLLEQVREPSALVIVHSAGMLTKDSVKNIEAEVLRQVLQLNVVAAAQLNKVLIPKMQEGSSLLYISSTLGTKAVANTHAYVISKHAVIGQMRATCQDLAGKGIHTACVCPGFTETEMLQNHLQKNPELYDQLASRMALKRLAQPIEIAETLWFCSQKPVINGAVIHANLGQIEQ
jgi:NAD(P)-dependent dehydrogenase (short-subunit alcohol dehydrogenase family)